MSRPGWWPVVIGLLVVVGVLTMISLRRGSGMAADSTATTTSVPIGTTSPTTGPTLTSTTEPPVSSTTEASSTTTPPIYESSISAVSAQDLYASWHTGCPVAPEALSLVTLTHWGFNGEVLVGRLVVATDLADDVVDIFHDLFDARFPIERMEPIDVFGGDDDLAMAANNTSAFNCRAVTGGTAFSEHSYGRAIDVNPLLNPYVRGDLVLPPDGATYLDRGLGLPGMITAGDAVVEAFGSRGWIWGGTWSSLQDYQHFSTTGR